MTLLVELIILPAVESDTSTLSPVRAPSANFSNAMQSIE
jgi:hypothetical protein